ncbi:death resistor Adh domain containing target isoform X2 [Arctopsyche grandis]
MMSKLCRQVSIESPGPLIKDSVFTFDVPVPEVPSVGARIRVVCAGACYRASRGRSMSVCSTSSISSLNSLSELAEMGTATHAVPTHAGMRDGALFPGYEVAGIVDTLGDEIDEHSNCGISVGQRIVLFPYEGVPHGYADYIVVPELKYLVPIPDSLKLSVAAMLPTGALLAMNAVYSAHECIKNVLQGPDHRTDCKILIVGTGGLALWTLRIAANLFKNLPYGNSVQITVACLKDEGLALAHDSANLNVVQWSEDLYENQLIERTQDSCKGPVDIVLDFGATSRSLRRSLRCLAKGGVVLLPEDVAERLIPRFGPRAEDMGMKLREIPSGTIDQLKELVKLVNSGEIAAPPHSVFPAEEAQDVVQKLCQSEIKGRAILRFYDVD